MLPTWLLSGIVTALAYTLVVAVVARRGRSRQADSARTHREVSAALSRERAILAAVLDAMDEGVIVTDTDGKFVVFNPAAEQIIGRERADVGPSQWPDTYGALHEDGTTRIEEGEFILLKALRGEEPAPALAVFRHEDADVHVRAVAKPVRDEGGRLLGAAEVLHDITQLKRAEAERGALIQDLEHRNRELERFTYTVSHELKTPLVTIQGFIGFLKQDVERGDLEQAVVDADRIEAAARTMVALLEDLLRLSRSGVVIDTAGSVDLNDIVAEVVASLSGAIEESGAHVEVVGDLPRVRGDARRLFEVFRNLVENSLKFMGGEASPKVSIGAHHGPSEVVCYVTDNGLGIDEAHRERVFRLFERVDTAVEGTGVGLALVKGIVEAHGGSVSIESEKGKGTTVSFTLPRVSGDRAGKSAV